jgi:hypothetical protein
MDVEQLAQIETDNARISGTERWGFDLRISADGQMITTWHNGIYPSGFGVARFAGGKLTGTGLDGAGFNGNWLQPNADGSLLMLHNGHLVSGDLKAYSADWLIGWILMATEDPRFFLAAKDLDVAVCTSNDRRPIFTITDKALDRMNSSSDPTRWYHTRGEPRIHYLPDQHLLAMLTDTQVVVRPFNLIEELEKGGKEYLFVLSQPKTHVKSGSVFQYQMDVKSKSAGIAYKLEKGPDGMTVSGSGEVRWNVPQNQTGIATPATPVIISVKNAAGKELFHTFDLIAD